MTDHWLRADVDFSDGEPEAVADLLESIAETVRAGPDDYRYDGTIRVIDNE